MDNHQSQPKWWTLYLIVASLFGLFFLESRARLSQTGHQLVQISVVLVIFIAIWLWYSANEIAILREEMRRKSKTLQRSPEPVYLVEEIEAGSRRQVPRQQIAAIWQLLSAGYIWLVSAVTNLFQR